MLPPDHDCFDLQTRAALVSGWPVLHVFAPDEATMLDAREQAELALGPLAQADEIAPWDEHDPDEQWELRIVLPGLTGADWRRLSTALTDFTALLVRGDAPGIADAVDGQQRVADVLEAGGLAAELWFNADDGGVLQPELEPLSTLEVDDLTLRLLMHLQAHDVRLPVFSDKGADTLEAVRDRRSGRIGIRGFIPSEHLDALDGEALMGVRTAVVTALAELVREQREGPLPLAPDLLWDTRLGLGFVLWTLQPPQPVLPGDTLFAEALSPSPDVLPALLRGAPGWCDSFEVQVWTDEHALVDMVLTEALTEAPVALVGGAPRWVITEDGPRFALVWQLVDLAADGLALGLMLMRLRAMDGVRGVRVVPAELNRTGDAWPQCDPTWWLRGRQCFVRLRDGLPDRDRWLAGEDRDRDERDDVVERALGLALLKGSDLPVLEEHEGRLLRAVKVGEHQGAELRFGKGTTPDPEALERLFDALGLLRAPALASVHLVALRRSGARVLLAYRPS